MKKIYTSFLVLFVFTFSIIAQPCIPDPSLTVPGFSPDETTNLPNGTVNVPYETVISALIPETFVYGGFTVQVATVTITGITGLPTGLTWTSDVAGHTWNGGGRGCLLIEGTTAIEGTHNLKIYTSSYASLGGNPIGPVTDSIVFYRIIMEEEDTNSVKEIEKPLFSINQSFPNPATDIVNIEINSLNNSNISLELFNLVGIKMMENAYQLNSGINIINFSVNQLPTGMYFYKISDGIHSKTKKLNIAK